MPGKVLEGLFADEGEANAGSAEQAEARLRLELDEEIKKGGKNAGASSKQHLSKAGKKAPPGFSADPLGSHAYDEKSESGSEEGGKVGFLGDPPQASGTKKGKKNKKEKKDSKKKKKESKKSKSKKEKKKKRKSTSSSSDSSSSTDSSSSVFRVGKTGNDRISQARMITWAAEHPGKIAHQLLRKMKAVVAQDGEGVQESAEAPAVAKQFDLRYLKVQPGPKGDFVHRNQRELTTLCVVLDHLALGRNRQAADVVAARLKSVETANREGDFSQASFLELVAVNPEGLTTVDEKLLIRNESHQSQKKPHSFVGGWQNYGGEERSSHPYSWIPKGKGKGKKGDGKGKKGAKGKKGDGKGKKD